MIRDNAARATTSGTSALTVKITTPPTTFANAHPRDPLSAVSPFFKRARVPQ